MLTQRDARVIEVLPEIKVPSLVVVGADDTPFLAASDYMAAKIPGAKKVVMPAAGHAVNIDQPQAFIEAVLPFLDGIRPERSPDHADRHGRRRSLAFAGIGQVHAQGATPDVRRPFTATLSNNVPLVFGMDVSRFPRHCAASAICQRGAGSKCTSRCAIRAAAA